MIMKMLLAGYIILIYEIEYMHALYNLFRRRKRFFLVHCYFQTSVQKIDKPLGKTKENGCKDKTLAL